MHAAELTYARARSDDSVCNYNAREHHSIYERRVGAHFQYVASWQTDSVVTLVWTNRSSLVNTVSRVVRCMSQRHQVTTRVAFPLQPTICVQQLRSLSTAAHHGPSPSDRAASHNPKVTPLNFPEFEFYPLPGHVDEGKRGVSCSRYVHAPILHIHDMGAPAHSLTRKPHLD
jgi:hypothetical protein